MANFRGLDERLTIKTPHEKGLPTSTLAGPENEMVTPTSVTEYARSLKELRLGGGPGGVALPWFELTERLVGRLFRCKA